MEAAHPGRGAKAVRRRRQDRQGVAKLETGQRIRTDRQSTVRQRLSGQTGRRFHTEGWFDDRSTWTSYGHGGRGLNDPNREGQPLKGGNWQSGRQRTSHGRCPHDRNTWPWMQAGRKANTAQGERFQITIRRDLVALQIRTGRSPEKASEGQDREGPHKGPQVMIRKPSDRAGSV